MPTLGTHPSGDALGEFAVGKLDDMTAAAIMNHLDGCSDLLPGGHRPAQRELDYNLNSKYRSAEKLRRCLMKSWAVLLAFSSLPLWASAAAGEEPRVVPVAKPVERQVTDFLDFTGRTSAVNSVTIVPRVTGYLVKISFKEGTDVKRGDLLFEVDPRPYQGHLDVLKAKLAHSNSSVRLAKTAYARLRELAQKQPGAVSQADLDHHRAQEEQAVAGLDQAKASLETAKLNLEWTRITAPIDGRIGRSYLTIGNLVNQDMTHLTTLVSLDPMYVFFDMDEMSLLHVKRAVNEKQMTRLKGGAAQVLMGLQGEQGYPHPGTLDFVDNRVNPSTGTITMRGVFPNPRPKNGGSRLLLPGMFARVRLPLGEPRPALLVIDRAIMSDQGLKYVYVINADNQVAYRRVTAGALQPDGLRVIEQGLKTDDWIMIGGMSQVRPRVKVQPDRVPMPALVQPETKRPNSAVPEPGDREENARESAAIQALLKERRDLLAKAVDRLRVLYKEGRVDFARVARAQRDVLKAALDQDSPAERKAALEKYQKTAANLVRITEALYKSGLGLEVDVLQAQAVMLEAQIELRREAVKGKGRR